MAPASTPEPSTTSLPVEAFKLTLDTPGSAATFLSNLAAQSAQVIPSTRKTALTFLSSRFAALSWTNFFSPLNGIFRTISCHAPHIKNIFKEVAYALVGKPVKYQLSLPAVFDQPQAIEQA